MAPAANQVHGEHTHLDRARLTDAALVEAHEVGVLGVEVCEVKPRRRRQNVVTIAATSWK